MFLVIELIYFHDYKLAIKNDENVHSDGNIG